MSPKQIQERLLQRARDLGVDVEVLTSETRELTLGAFEGNLAETTQATRGGVGLRVVAGGKTGYAYTEERTTEALDWAFDEAHENALLQSTTDGFLPQGEALGERDLIGEGLSAPIDAKANTVLELERSLRADSRLKQVSLARYTEREETSTLASTQGASGGFRNGMSAVMASYILTDGQVVKQGFEFDAHREYHRLEPGRTALEMLERTGRHLGAKPLKTGRYTAVFEPKPFAHLLSVLLFMLSGKTVMEGRSRLADRLGSRVASPLVTLRDDATLPQGLASRPFDSEGTPARPVTLVEDGILRSFLHNSQTARAAGHENTGHAARSYKGTLGVSATNLILSPGSGLEAKDAVVVTDLMGLHAGANPVTGDISLQALGLWQQDGEVTHAVENFALSLNLLEALERIRALGSTLEYEFAGAYVGAPHVEIPEVSFAGA